VGIREKRGRKQEGREGVRKYSNHSSSKFFGMSTSLWLLLRRNPLPPPAQTPPAIWAGH
jgi:hypothetical protein